MELIITAWNQSNESTNLVQTKGQRKKQEKFFRPFLVTQCNSGIGEVDLLETSLSDFWLLITEKKWYWSLIINALNIGFVLCWCFFTTGSGEHVPQEDYWRHAVSILLRSSIPSMEVRSRPASLLNLQMRYEMYNIQIQMYS